MSSSTGCPALTIIMILRGFLTFFTSSSIEWQPMKVLPFARPSMNASTFSVVRLNTATLYPRLSTLSARFSPITARPMRPKSAGVAGMEVRGSGFGTAEEDQLQPVLAHTGFNAEAQRRKDAERTETL